MAGFNADAYFKSKPFNPTGTDKITDLISAREEKVQALGGYSQSQAKLDEVNKNSLVSRLDLTPQSVPANIVNTGANVAKSLADFGGWISSAPMNITAALNEQGMTDVDTQAFTRYKQGTATPEDLTILGSKKIATLYNNALPEIRAEAQRKADENDEVPTVLQSLQRAEADRTVGRKVSNAFDIKGIVHNANTEEWNANLGKDFDPKWGAIKDGFKRAVFEGDNSKVGAALSGVAGLAGNIGNALVDSPMGAVEALAGNVAQLGSGLLGRVGRAALGASNVGNAADIYSKGIEDYQKKHDGALPSEEERSYMQAAAVAWAASEQAGDKLQIGAFRGVKDASRTSFKDAIRNTGTAARKGAQGEAPTEATQSFLEGEIKQEPTSAKQMFIEGVTGGIVGAGFSGGGRALGEIKGITPEKIEAKAKAEDTFREAGKTGNVDTYLNKESKDYDPIKAVQSLFINNEHVETTPETKQQNIDKTNSIINDLETQRTELADQISYGTKEGIQKKITDIEASLGDLPPKQAANKQLQLDMLNESLATFDDADHDAKHTKQLTSQLSGLDRQLAEVTKVRDQAMIRNKPTEASIIDAVDKADAPVDATTEESKATSQASANHVISLAMAHPGMFSDESLTRLADNAANGLSEGQRRYLRNVSAAKIAENAAKNYSTVQKEIFEGDPEKRQLGIKDYVKRMAEAVSANNESKAETALHMLGKFTAAHAQKSGLFTQLYEESKKPSNKGKSFQVVPVEGGGWMISPETYTERDEKGVLTDLRKVGGIEIHKGTGKVVKGVVLEATALNAAKEQLQAAYNLKFDQSAIPAVSSTVQPPVAAVAPVAGVSTESTLVTSTPNQSTGVDSIVDPVVPSTTTASTPAQGTAPVATVKSVFKTLEESWKAQEGSLGETVSVINAGIKTAKEGEPFVAEADALKAKKNRTLEEDLRISELDDIYMLLGIKNDPTNELLESEQTWLDEKTELQEHPEDAGNDYAEARIKAIDALLVNLQEFKQRVESLVNKASTTTPSQLGYDQQIQDDSGYSKATPEVQAEVDVILNELDQLESESNGTTKTKTESVEATTVVNEIEEQETVEGGNQDSSTDGEAKPEIKDAGKLSVFQEVIDLAGKKFSEVYQTINLAAYNLKQKLGKNNKTQRPLVAVKDFLSNWPNEAELAKFVGVDQLNDAQKVLLKHFKETVSSNEAGTGWLDIITKNLVAGRVMTSLTFGKDKTAVNKAKKAFLEEKNKGKDADLVKLEELRSKFKKLNDALEARLKTGEYTNLSQETLNELRTVDPIQYFLLTNSDKPNLEENLKTAIAVAMFSYVAENAKTPETKEEESVKRMFGLGPFDPIGGALVNRVATLGDPIKVVQNSLGARVTQALGFGTTDVATKDFLPKLESSIGAHAVKALVDAGVMEQSSVSSADITRGLAAYHAANAYKNKDSLATPEQGSMNFVRMARIQNNKLNQVAETISDKTKGTGGVLGKLFGVDSQNQQPSWEAVPFTQNATASGQGIPPDLAEIVKQENATPFKVNKPVWYMILNIPQNEFLKLAGWVDIEANRAFMHKNNIKATEAKNDALVREYEVAKEYIEAMTASVTEGGSAKGLDTEIFLPHYVWEQQRVGIASELNPQTSKIHRWLLTRDAWATEVSVDAQGNSDLVPDSETLTMLDSFKLRVMEGLGVKTDKQDNAKSLAGFEELFNVDSLDTKTKEKANALMGAIESLQASLNGVEYDPALIVAGVVVGGEKMHSLDALMAMARYLEAKKDGKAYSFDVTMMGEVDGVTNGPMLSHLVLGVGSRLGETAVDRIMNRLNKGGFYPVDSKIFNYNVWRGQDNNQDLYESTIAAVIKLVQEGSNKAHLPALELITGRLDTTDGKVSKDGRNIIKTPLTAMLFGSAINGAISSMFRDFTDKAYAGFEKIAKMPEGTSEEATAKHNALQVYVSSLNSLLVAGDHLLLAATTEETIDNYVSPEAIPFSSIEQFLTDFEFSKEQEAALEAVFNSTLGKQVKIAMESEFGDFIGRRDAINDAANVAFDLYDAAYEGIRKLVISELVAKGDIAAGKDGKQDHDLTDEQEAIINSRIKALNPTVHTYMSKQSKDKNAKAKYGLQVAKSSRELSKENSYKGEIHFGTPLPETLVNGKPVKPFGIATAAYRRMFANPGVRMLPLMMHSLDSAIAHLALVNRAVLNVHDAAGTGIHDFIVTAKAMNKAVWQVMLNYSPTTEMRDTFIDTLLGMDTLLARNPGEDVINNIREKLITLSIKNGDWVDNVKVPADPRYMLTLTAHTIFSASHAADKAKYETMSLLGYIDQYALEGGQYVVSKDDRAEAAKKLKELGPKAVIPKSILDAIDRINEVAFPSPKAKVVTTTDVHAVLKEHGTLPAKGILRMLANQLKNSPTSSVVNFQRALLTELGKRVPDKLNIHWKQPSIANSIGEYVPGGDIYISPDISMDNLIEAILHETTHAVTYQAIANGDPTIIKELNALLTQVRTFVSTPEFKSVTKTDYSSILSGDSGIYELVSWGMNNKDFQDNVLLKIDVPSEQNENRKQKFVKAFAEFISTVTKAVFGDVSGKRKDIVNNGMSVLITNFSGLLAQAAEQKGKPQQSSGPSLAMQNINNIQDLTTESLYNALDEGKVTPTFDDHLRSLLTSIVDKLHGPYGTFKSQIERNLVRTPKGLWDQAKKDGTVPFASEALSAPIQMNDQVAFVLEQVEVTVAGALSENKGEAYAISTELDKLYREAKTKLTGTNSPLSQELQDFMFNMKGNHLARFAALGLAHPEINEALKFGTSTVDAKASKSLSARLETLFHKVLEWFNGKMTHTHAGQQADEKLAALVNGLVSIEEKRKAPMLVKSSTLAYVESVLQSGTDKIKSKVEAAASSNLIKNSKSGLVKGAGAVVSTIAGNRTDQVMEVLQAVRDKQFRQGQGLAISMINEVRGANDGNKMFHKLLREAKLREGTREDLITHTSNVALGGFANEGKDLSQKDKEALTTGILRTDLAALLGPFDMDQITEMVGSPAARNKAIIALEKELDTMKHKDFYVEHAKALAYHMVTGQSKVPHLLLNASNIAHVADTGYKVNIAEAVVATSIIDQLVSLYALKYTNQAQLAAASKIMDAEAKRGNESGVEGIIRLHKAMQKQSKDELFSGSEALMVKGYLPEIYDPKKEVLIATEADGKSLVAQGYKKQPKHVTYDPTDPSSSTERFLYTRDGGGLRPWLSGAMSTTSEASKGSRSRSNEVKDLLDWIVNKQELASMYKAKRAAMAKGFKANPNFDPSAVKTNYAVPIMNADRQVSDYRYMMQRENKDLFLNPDNRFDKVLGSFAGSIYDKTSTKTHNREVVKALYNQYITDFATKSVSYRVFGPNSTDPELRDMYRMLPEDTKQAIKEIWGENEDGASNGMLVRSDLMDITFGYRKQSVTDAFNKEKKNIAEQFFVSVATTAMGEKAAYNIRRFEDVWQELVGEAKDILVVKNVSTLLGNIGSNVSLLYWHGVPFKDMVKHHRIAMKGITNYRADSAALIELETKLKSGIVTTSKSEMQHEITRLQAAIDSNPVKDIIDAGLMPSIVEDVSPEDDVYSYKSRLVGLVDDKTSGVNKHIKGAARNLYMAKDTKAYQVLRHGTQLSDFVARYTLYQHVTTRKDNPMGKEEAVQLASDAFINYDIPSHRNLQYMNDMGFVMFTKYYMRIQKVIAHLYADKPGRALAMLAFESYFANAPMLTDSGFLHKMGNNPFTLGAFNYPGTLDELATIKAIMYPFK